MSSIEVKNLVLDYPVSKIPNFDPERHSDVGGRILKVNGSTYLRAIDNVTIDIQSGDRVGIIGHNGAGKSTLLKTLGGIYKPTSGTVIIEGKIAPLFNLKFGMDMSLSGHENIILKALHMGVRRKDIEAKIDEIEALSGLGEFIHLPMKTYSSGMVARLAFAISTKIDADILLLDEMIGTGDANFIKQTSQIAKNFVQSSNLLLIASHSNKVIRDMCTKAIVFEHGKVVDFTNVSDALKTYNQRSTFLGNNAKAILSGKPNVSKGKRKGYLLVNDTSSSDNLGCKAVEESIELLLGKISYCVDSVKLGYGSEYFSHISSKSSDWVDKTNGFPRYKDFTSNIDFGAWEKSKKEFHKNDEYLRKIDNFDFVVVNAEGSIHHNSKRALALLAQIEALSKEKPVFVLNASIFNMDEQILKESLKKVKFIHSREGFTFRYLKEMEITSVYAPDIASVYISTLSYCETIYVDQPKELCLVSTGVLSGPEYISSVIDLVKSKGMEPVYLSMSDGNEDNVSTVVCQKLGVKHFRACDISIDRTLDFLGQFKWVISGRHHLNIFVLAANKKLACLPSNTLKVEGTLGFISKQRPMAYSLEELDELLDDYHFEVPENIVKSFAKIIERNVLSEINEHIESI